MTEYEAYWINNKEVSAANLATTKDMMLPGSVRERVIRRWLNLNLCGRIIRSRGELRSSGAGERSLDRRCAAAAGSTDARGRPARVPGARPLHGRTSLLLFSPGFVEDEELPLTRIRAASRESNTAVYFIDSRGLMTDGGLGQVEVKELDEPGNLSRMRFEQRNLASPAPRASPPTPAASRCATRTISRAERSRSPTSPASSTSWASAPPRRGRRTRGASSSGGREARPEGAGPPRLHAALHRTRADDPAVKAAKKKKKKNEDEAEPTPGVKAALDSIVPLPGIPLQVMVYVLEPRANGNTHVLVAAELDARQLAFRDAGAQRLADLELGITATHRDTGHGFLHSKELAMAVTQGEPLGWRGLVREFELTTGVHQARVVVRDRSTGRMGAVTQRFEVPFPGELRLSTPILTDRLVPAQGPQKRRNRRCPRTAPSFLRRALLPVRSTRRTAGSPHRRPKVAAGLEIRTRNGRVIRAVEPTPIEPDADGRLVRMVGMAWTAWRTAPTSSSSRFATR